MLQEIWHRQSRPRHQPFKGYFYAIFGLPKVFKLLYLSAVILDMALTEPQPQIGKRPKLIESFKSDVQA
jgi:hypothetical protein